MATVNFYSKAVITIPGAGKIELGDISTPISVTLDASSPDIYVNRVALANGEDALIAELGSGHALADFKFLAIYCSVDMDIVFGGEGSQFNNSAVVVEGGTFFYLFNDEIKAYQVTLADRVADTNANQDIQQIYAGNDSGSSGYVQIWLAR